MLRRFFAERVGTFSLLVPVVGAGIMAEKLAGGNVAAFIAVQLVAAIAATYTFKWLLEEY